MDRRRRSRRREGGRKGGDGIDGRERAHRRRGRPAGGGGPGRVEGGGRGGTRSPPVHTLVVTPTGKVLAFVKVHRRLSGSSAPRSSFRPEEPASRAFVERRSCLGTRGRHPRIVACFACEARGPAILPTPEGTSQKERERVPGRARRYGRVTVSFGRCALARGV